MIQYFTISMVQPNRGPVQNCILQCLGSQNVYQVKFLYDTTFFLVIKSLIFFNEVPLSIIMCSGNNKILLGLRANEKKLFLMLLSSVLTKMETGCLQKLKNKTNITFSQPIANFFRILPSTFRPLFFFFFLTSYDFKV